MFTKYDNLIKENGFDKRYFMYMEDVDLSRRMFKYGNYFFPEVKIIHNFNKSSFKSLKMTFKHVESAIKYFNKWGWFSDQERKKINYHYINSNLPESIVYFKQDCRKISADLYIDDKCLMGIPDTWEEIYNITLKKMEKYYEYTGN